MIKFSEQKLAKVSEIISRYPVGKQKSALLPVLHMAQDEFGGWLDVPVMDYVATLLNIEPIEVYEVASFYSMYNICLKFARPALVWSMAAIISLLT